MLLHGLFRGSAHCRMANEKANNTNETALSLTKPKTQGLRQIEFRLLAKRFHQIELASLNSNSDTL